MKTTDGVKGVNSVKNVNLVKNVKYVLDVKKGYRVEFAMLAGRDVVTADVSFEQAKAMLSGGRVRETKTVPGYPLTADGKYFFRGGIEKPLDDAPAQEGKP